MNLPAFTILLVSLLIGLHGSSRIAGRVRNFYVAGNIIPSWVIALSLLGQAIDSGSSLGNASGTAAAGFWSGAALPIGIGLSLMLIGLFFAEPLHRMRILTLGDFYGRRYGRGVETIASVLCVASFSILLASNLAGAGIVLHHFVPLPVGTLVAVVASVTMVYVIAGGLFAATWNDVLHTGIMLTGFGAAAVWLLHTTAPEVVSSAFEQGFSWEPLYRREEGALATWATLIALGVGDIVALDFMERVFAAKTPRHARLACLGAGVGTIVLGVAIAIIGLIARVGLGPDAGAETLLEFVATQLPAGLAMMVFMALISACLSTSDGVLMACSKVLTRNIVQHNFPRLIPPERLLAFSRLCLIPLTLGAAIFAIVRPDPGDLLVLAFEVVLAGCFVPLVLGIYWRRANARAALWAIVIPSLLRVALYFVVPESWAGLDTLLPPLVSLAIFVAVAMASPPPLAPAEVRERPALQLAGPVGGGATA